MAWAHGLDGAMATAGASTGSLTAAGGAIAAVADTRPTIAALPGEARCTAVKSAAVAESATMAEQSVKVAMRDPVPAMRQ